MWPNWLNRFGDDSHLGYNTKLEKETLPGTYYSTCSLLIAFILAKHWQIFFSVPGGQMMKWNLSPANVLLKNY
jgi:hypothetical protein